LVPNNDFAPTIAQLAGASIPDPQQVDGSSFAPLLSNPQEPTNWRTAFLEEGWRPQSPPIPTHKSVHTQDHMFTEYSTGERELYDLNADPYQERSIKQTTAPQLYSTLQSRLNALRACSGDGCRSAEGFSGTPPPPPPETSPSVTSTVPKAGATGVAPSSNLTATFSEKMDPASITTSTFKLFKVNPDGTQTQITNVTVALSTDGLVATLNPFGSSTTMHLASGTKYKGVITTGARDVAGNPLDQIPTAAGLQMKAWTFTVSP
jgi:Bacterial Ig-like domain/Domain of unknown function (DUF4976)